MAEYMDYNGVDEPKKKSKKILSAFVLGFSILWLIVLVGWVFFFSPQTVRSKFNPVISETHSYGYLPDTNNEFIRLNKNLSLKPDPINVDKTFEKQYPEIFKIFSSNPGKYSSSKPESFDDGRNVVVAMPYTTSRYEKKDLDKKVSSGENGLDVLVVPYKSSLKKENGEFLSVLNIERPQRFSFRYSYKSENIPTVRSYPLDEKRYKLNFYSLAFDVNSVSKMTELNYTFESENISINMMKELSKKIYIKNSETTKGIMVDAKEGSNRFSVKFGSASLTENGGSDIWGRLRIKFDDLMYKNFFGIEIITKSADLKSHFTITIN